MSRNRSSFGHGRTYSEIVGFGVLSSGLRATSTLVFGFGWLRRCSLRDFCTASFMIVLQDSLLWGKFAFNGSSARLAVVAQPAASRLVFDLLQLSGG